MIILPFFPPKDGSAFGGKGSTAFGGGEGFVFLEYKEKTPLIVERGMNHFLCTTASSAPVQQPAPGKRSFPLGFSQGTAWAEFQRAGQGGKKTPSSPSPWRTQ